MDTQYIIGFFIIVLLVGGAGYLHGRRRGRTESTPVPTETVRVVNTLPDVEQVKVLNIEGRQYTIGKKTEGVDWSKLKLGDKLYVIIEDGVIRRATLG